MVHLAALPGSPCFDGSLAAVEKLACADAQALTDGGVDAIMIENFGDAPFTKGRVDAVTVASMTRCALAIRAETSLPLGINVLRNDAISALAVASAVGASFIRVNVLVGARVTDQGVVEGDAYSLSRARVALGAQAIGVWADVDVKHSAPLSARPFAEEVAETVDRGFADVVIVSGSGTGAAVDPERVAAAAAATRAPVVLGSGVTAANIGRFTSARGAIVGSSLKTAGGVRAPVCAEKVRALMRAVA